LAEFKKKEEAEVERQVAKIKVAKEKAAKEKVVSEIPKEMPEKGKKRTRVEDEIDVIVGDALLKDSVMWEVKVGKTCDPCSHMGRKCYWRDGSKHAMVCYGCHFGKKVCRGVGEKAELAEAGKAEAGPQQKKRAAEGKGKEVEKPVAVRRKWLGWSWDRGWSQ